MNEYMSEVRRRGRNLLIVEGNHEKNKLFWLVFRCFPEIQIDMDDVWVYGTNIYMLYGDIVKEYGSEWVKEGEDIDLPFVLSKKQYPDALCYKEDFVNIILVFDYERHDTNFSEAKILTMQKYFVDAADMGKLYINYPMIESYMHLRAFPDEEYAGRKIPVSLQPGKKYKKLVDSETIIGKIVELPHRIDDLLDGRFEISDIQMRKECCDEILSISDEAEIDSSLEKILQNVVTYGEQSTLRYQLKDWIMKAGYVNAGQTFWEYIRELFQEIIYHNICKANIIQNGQYQIEQINYRKCFENLNLTDILRIQNKVSQDFNEGYIWVLNTCVFFVAEYNFALVSKADLITEK